MTIPTNLFIIVDILIGAILLFTLIKGFINGFVFELIDICFLIISIIAAWFISPILSEKVTIFKFNLNNELFDKIVETTNFTTLVNNIIWFVIIVAVLNLLFILIKPIFKKLSKVPVLGFINRLAGGLIGIIKGLFITILVSLILTSPIFKNGKQIKENTVLKYCEAITNLSTKYIVNNINFENLKDEIDDFDVEKARDTFSNWLIDQGIFDE